MTKPNYSQHFKRTELINNTFNLHYENNVFVGVIYQESHGEWVVCLEQHSGYVAAHHLHGIAQHLDQLNEEQLRTENNGSC